jgi:3-oxoadipate enol-lactonase
MKKYAIAFFLSLIVGNFLYSQQNTGEVKVDSSGYINVGDGKLFYETAGEGPIIILLHDGIVHREIWDNQFSYFSKNYKVIRYDRRSYGKSSPGTNSYSHVEDLKSVFDYFKIDKACLFGMSSGGKLVIDFTLKYPDKVNAMVLVGAVVGGFPYTEHMRNRGGHFSQDFSDMEKVRMFFITDDPYEIYSENKEAREKVLNLVKNNPRKGGHGELAEDASSKPAYQRLNEIKVPALILVGEYDMPDVHAHAGAINAGIKNSTRDIILKSGHLIPIEQPDIFNKKVQLFLNSLLVEECKKK